MRHQSLSISISFFLLFFPATDSGTSTDRLDHGPMISAISLSKHAYALLHRKYKSSAFKPQLLTILRTLRVPLWQGSELTPDLIKISKVSGSLTNAVFFVSCPSEPLIPTLLLRIYGPSSGALISRPRELHTLHILSSQYRIGPRVYGTFGNGRVEEYFESVTLTASDLRDENVSRWIGARMAELHCVDIEAIEETSPVTRGEGKGWEIGAKKNVKAWLAPAREVLALPAVTEASRRDLDLDVFMKRWEKYMRWLKEFEKTEGASRRVFAHNDAQYGNLLKLARIKEGLPEHHQVCKTGIFMNSIFPNFAPKVIVVDFEYASPNPAAFDIANHFHEWTANYHSSTPHMLDPSRYPTAKERRNFYLAYMTQSVVSSSVPPETIDEAILEKMDRQVKAWSPASQAMWAVWGIVQAKEDLEGKEGELEFDYIEYARCRMEGFRRETKALGL